MVFMSTVLSARSTPLVSSAWTGAGDSVADGAKSKSKAGICIVDAGEEADDLCADFSAVSEIGASFLDLP